MARYQYITLMTALPSLGKTFHVELPPLSRFQLERRLNLLTDEHRGLLASIEGILHWDHLNSHYDDRELIDSAHAVLDSLQRQHYPDIRRIILWRLDLRTLLAAFRYRQQDNDVEDLHGVWGIGEITRHIEANWAHRYFNLQYRYPWISRMEVALNQNDTMGLETLLFDITWHFLKNCAPHHEYDFTAVVRYVLMWNLVSRWTAYDEDKGVAHFQELVDFALGDFKEIKFAQVE